MKLILSRKGFDSGAGGVPSPIFPDGSMYSIPIQAPGGRTPYARIRRGDASVGAEVGSVVSSLTRGRTRAGALCHFDPDLDAGALDRPRGWRPSLGQVNAAQGHLAAQSVGPGDIFLFFGWFRRVDRAPDGGWRFIAGAPDLHVIFGWLRIGEILDVPNDPAARAALIAERPGVADHPHLHFPAGYVRGSNRIYLGAEGDAGEFRAFDDRLVLTAPGATRRGDWRLPTWFRAARDRTPLTYHADPARWSTTKGHCSLRTVGRGQEFVLDCANRPEAHAWIDRVVGAPQVVAPG